MPLPVNTQLQEYYQHIADITGIDFKSGSLEDVNRALSRIYIDGHSYFANNQTLTSLDDTAIREISHRLDQTLSATDDAYSFISIMNYDDPYAVPRIIENKALKDDRGRALDTSAMSAEKLAQAQDMQKKKAAAAKNYAADYKKNHAKKLDTLSAEVEKGVSLAKDSRQFRQFFSQNVMNHLNGMVRTAPVVRGLRQNFASVIDVCNLILINRGYTPEELLQEEGLNIQEGRKEVGQKMEELLFDKELTEEQREAGMHSLMAEALEGLKSLSFKPVDLSDDSTFENVKYNQWIADMADSMQTFVNETQISYKNYNWLAETWEDMKHITNFTQGIVDLDNSRIKAAQKRNRTAETVTEAMTAQTFIDNIGVNYGHFRAGQISLTQNDMSLKGAVDTVSVDIVPDSADTREKARYDRAYNDVIRNRGTENLKDYIGEKLAENPALHQIQEYAYAVAHQKPVLAEEEYISWFTAETGHSFEEYSTTLSEIFGAGQLARKCTVASLILMYGAWDAEQNGRDFSIEDYINDPVAQANTAEKAMEYFKNHPIRTGTDEGLENARLFGEMTAAFNRRLKDVTIPEMKWQNEAEYEQLVKLTNSLKTIYQDSEQLRELVPKDNKEMMDAYYSAFGGEKEYNLSVAQNSIGGTCLEAENRVLVGYRGLENRSIDSLIKNTDKRFEMSNLTTTAYFLANEGKQYLGRKIGEMPANQEVSAYYLGLITAVGGMFRARDVYAENKPTARETRNRMKQMVEYVKSIGEHDEAGIAEKVGTVKLVYREVNGQFTEADMAPVKYESKVQTPEESAAHTEAFKKALAERRQAEEKAAKEAKEAAEKAAAEEKARQEKEAAEKAEAEEKARQEKEAAKKAAAEEKARQEKEAAEKAAAEEKARQEKEAAEKAAAEEQARKREHTELESGLAHDWSSELSTADWIKRLDLMEKEMAANDPALLHSSAEYKAVREGLKEARKALEGAGGMDAKAFNASMDKVFGNAGDYIQKKENGRIGRHYGEARLDAMRNLRGMLANRNSKALQPEGLGDLFGDKIGEVPKLETAFLRLGAYLAEAKQLEETQPQESRRMVSLVERVLAERGKNSSTRKALKEELALRDTALFDIYGQPVNHADKLRQAKDAVIKVMRSKASMTETAGNWFQVMNAYETMGKHSEYEAVVRSANLSNVREMALCGRLAEAATQTRYKAMDYDAPDKLTAKEATEMVAYASIGEFMRHPDSSAHVRVFNTFMKRNADTERLLKNFADQDTVKKLTELSGKEAVKNISSRKNQEMLGILGKGELCSRMKAESELQAKQLDKVLAFTPAQMKAMKEQNEAGAPENKAGIIAKNGTGEAIKKKIDALNHAAKGMGMH